MANDSDEAAAANAASREADAFRNELIVTYRFLRLGIVAAVAVLAVAVVLEWRSAGCLKGSISSYFYSPVRSVFVGGLIAIGLCLIAVRGRSNWEEFWLNLGGFFAPVVALVPTRPSGDCPSPVATTPGPIELNESDPLPEWVLRGIANNVAAYLAISVAALVGLWIWFFIVRTKPDPDSQKARQLRFALTAYTVLIAVGCWLYLTFDGFKTHAHWAAAILMFVCFFFVVMINWRRRPSSKYTPVYLVIAVLMLAAAVIIGGLKLLAEKTDLISPWNQDVFWLEVVEIGLFALFWAIQTKQRWTDETVPAILEAPGRPDHAEIR